MKDVTFEELRKAFEELCDMIGDMPCGFEEYAGPFVTDVRNRLNNQGLGSFLTEEK